MIKVYKEWSVFGWQGISFHLPAEWNLGAVEGDERKGYLRIDDPLITRMEVRWEKSRSNVPTDKIVEQYIRTLKKRAKAKRYGLRVERRIKVRGLEKKFKNRTGESFIWEADFRSYNIVWHCQKCKRVLLVGILSRPEEDIKAVVEKIYASLEDHPERGLNKWGIYGFVFKVPTDFSLKSHSLKSGDLQLFFERGREELECERISLASILLKGRGLEEWFKEFYAERIKQFQYELKEEKVIRHQGIKINGNERRRLIPKMKLLNLRRLKLWLWHCPVSDKIFLVQMKGRNLDERLIEGVAREVQCH